MALLGGVCLAACGGGGASAPTVTPPAVAPAPVDAAAECDRIGRLAAAGDHKPAVDGFDRLVVGGGACSAEIGATVDDSRQLLADADALVRAGLEARRAGDVAKARASLRRALEIYPRYHWARRLVDELPAQLDPIEEGLLQSAAELRAAGRVEEALALLEGLAADGPRGEELAAELTSARLELGEQRLELAYREQRAGNLAGAIEWTLSAIAVAPGEPVRTRVADFARRLGLDLFSAGELVEARSVWQAALALDENNEQLHHYLAEVELRLRSLEDIKAADDG